MASDINSVTIAGRLTRPAEYKQFQSGSGVFNLSIASNQSRKDQSGQYQDVPSFFEAKYFAKTQNMGQYLQKGTQVVIQGSLSQERWTGQDGKNNSKVVINVNQLQLVGGKQNGGNSQGGNYPPPQNFPDNGGGFAEDLPF